MALTVSKLAARVGVRPDTVRFYERAGLLREPERTSAGYRSFGEDQVDRLLFIRGAQRLGLRLREIRELLEIRDSGLCPCEDVEALVRARMSEVERQIGDLTRLKNELLQMVERIPEDGCPPGADPWPCEEELIESGR